MSVLWVRESSFEGSLDSQWQRTYKRVFRVLCDNRTDGPVVCRSAADVPRMGQTYFKSDTERDDGAFVNGYEHKLITPLTMTDGLSDSSNRMLHELTVNYGPFNPYPKNPLEWPYKISWSFAAYERVVWFDINRKAIVNSAGVRFGEPVTMDDNRPILTISRNEQTYDPTRADTYRDKVNATPFLGADAGLVKVSAIPAEQLFNPDIGIYYNVKYEFHFNRDGWKKNILDCSFSVLDDSGNLQQVMTAKGQPVNDPVLLDGSGQQLPEGNDPVSLEFEVYESIDFAAAFNFDEALILGLSS